VNSPHTLQTIKILSLLNTPRAIHFHLEKKMQKSEKIRYQRLIYSPYKIQPSAILPPVLKSLEAKIQDGRHFLGLNRQKIQKNVF